MFEKRRWCEFCGKIKVFSSVPVVLFPTRLIRLPLLLFLTDSWKHCSIRVRAVDMKHLLDLHGPITLVNCIFSSDTVPERDTRVQLNAILRTLLNS